MEPMERVEREVIHSEAKDMYHSFFICTFMI